ncbi:MAG TPA: PQQ-dependent sugar dehydrogenase [Blastocatellia bacterium]|nr:PQQ-dependent sugar dehydrogenase [Blastocatellia bacterium]
MKATACVLYCLAILGVFPTSVSSQSAPQIELEPVATGLSSPVLATNAGDGSSRLFIVEQPGRIRVLQPGPAIPTVFLDISSRVVFGGEQGLLGLAFHPQFASNGRFFVDYTRRPDGATVIAEYHVSPGNRNIADPSETLLLLIAQPFANHNGGMLAFGRDGFLYIGMGDGGSANDPGNRAQDANQLLGKILRIDIDHPDRGRLYSSPPDNPFFGQINGRDEIFSLGLRNPWRFSFDEFTGDLYVGDVGQGAREEVDVVTRGGNYGWRVFEGTRCTNNDPSLCNPSAYIPPIAEYGHTGGRCSITGGYVYRGEKASLPFGSYVYADYCSGEIFLMQNGTSTVLMDTSLNISSFGEDQDREVYVVGLGGTVHRIVNPSATATPFVIRSAFIRRRATGEMLNPITIQKNGKRFEVVILEGASAPTPASQGAVVVVNGTALTTRYETTDLDTPIFVARLKKPMLRVAGPLVVQVVRQDGGRSNQLTLDIVDM